jgi:hypothetical protein
VNVDSVVVEHPDPSVAKLGQAGEPTAYPHGTDGGNVEIGRRVVAAANTDQLTAMNRRRDPVHGQTRREQLSAGPCLWHEKELARHEAGHGARWAVV